MACHVANEHITNPRPVTLREVPPTPEHLTDEWLTLALCRGIPGAKVLGHSLGPRSDGTSSRRTLRVEFDDVGRAAGLNEWLFTKSGPGYMTRLVSAAVRLGEIESAFYAQLRAELPIEAPATRYSAYDPVTNRQLLIIDDVSRTRGAHFDTILTRQLDRAQAGQLMDTLAALHARFWGSALHRRFGDWLLDSHEWMARLNITINAPKRIMVGFSRAREVIPAKLFRRRKEVPDALMRSLRINISGPQTLLHGDVHPGNWYVTGDNQMGLYDWQCAVRGGAARDVAYALSTHLTVENRRAWERDLLARYVDRLAVAGCGVPNVEAVFLAYRQQMFHAMFMWLVTIGRYRLQPEMQPKDVTLESVRRTCQAAEDLDSLDAITGRNRDRVVMGN
ncbi:aminoglycoside phosphotransferase family protein [Mycobacterium nebraskense]|uniref:aminoglycoside phosphotransferase family protein n=1 Tax=Mycobacterium nebraskense TaxID=244292 RepID=UPI0023F37A42|nr:aminoglycoside phosphotransferase family protein [Mycobacterium nebraskense]